VDLAAQGGPSIKLADFGSARWLKGSARPAAGQLQGSPCWMAPELIVGAPCSRTTDVWSVGGVLLEMLTGAPPWHGVARNAFQLMSKIASSAGPPPMPDSAPPALRDLLLRCFEREAAKRPSTAELIDHEWLAGVRRDG
jgi:serine/threonine protein kinase